MSLFREPGRSCSMRFRRKSSTKSPNEPEDGRSPWRSPISRDGEVEIDRDGRIFLVSHFTNGDGQVHERLIFLAQVTRKGEVFRERDEQGSPIVTERVRPFPIQPGRSEARDGIVIISRHSAASRSSNARPPHCRKPLTEYRSRRFASKPPGLHQMGTRRQTEEKTI